MNTLTAPQIATITSYDSCYALGGISVTLDRCLRLNSQARNRDLCRGCSSLRRKCLACMAQNLEDDLVWVCNPAKGLCAWHSRNGADALRTVSLASKVKTPELRPTPKLAPRSEVTISPKEYPGKRASRISSEEFTVSAYENDIRSVQEQIKKHWSILNYREKTLLQMYVRGLNSVEAAAEFKVSCSLITVTNRKLSRLLGIPDYPIADRVKKGQLHRWILVHACKRYLSGEGV